MDGTRTADDPGIQKSDHGDTFACSICQDLNLSESEEYWKTDDDPDAWTRQYANTGESLRHIKFEALARAARHGCRWCQVLQTSVDIFWGSDPAARSPLEKQFIQGQPAWSEATKQQEFSRPNLLILEQRPGRPLLAHRALEGFMTELDPDYYLQAVHWGDDGPRTIELFTAEGWYDPKSRSPLRNSSG
jgi:hypothetical protein